MFTVELPSPLTERLGELSQRTNRAASSLVVEAVTDFVERELQVIDGIERGLSDLRSGRVVPHQEAMLRVRATIRRGSTAKP